MKKSKAAKKSRKIAIVGIIAMCVSMMPGMVRATEIIASLETNGVLSARTMMPGSTCTVEWASSLVDGFTSDPIPLDGLIVNSKGVTSMEIPMFFRVSGVPLSSLFEDTENFVDAGWNITSNGLWNFDVTEQIWWDAPYGPINTATKTVPTPANSKAFFFEWSGWVGTSTCKLYINDQLVDSIIGITSHHEGTDWNNGLIDITSAVGTNSDVAIKIWCQSTQNYAHTKIFDLKLYYLPE